LVVFARSQNNALLRVIRLGLNQITSIGAEAIAAAIAMRPFALTQSPLASTTPGAAISPSSSSSFFSGSASTPNPSALQLTIAPPPALRHRITTLDLRFNAIGDGGAVAIAAALEGNATLTHLDLTRCEIGNIGARAIGLALLKTVAADVDADDDEEADEDGGLELGTGDGAANTRHSPSHPLSMMQTGEAVSSSHFRATSFSTSSSPHGSVGSRSARSQAGSTGSIGSIGSIGGGGARSEMRVLLLAQNAIGDVGALPVAEACRTAGRLETIDLHSNRVSDNVVYAFVRALEVLAI
jgi:hypothetical protein